MQEKKEEELKQKAKKKLLREEKWMEKQMKKKAKPECKDIKFDFTAEEIHAIPKEIWQWLWYKNRSSVQSVCDVSSDRASSKL